MLAVTGLMLGRTYARFSASRKPAREHGDDRGSNDVVVVQWNVENLFDYEDDPGNPRDNEFTPDTWRQWTEARYRIKLDHLARVIAELDGDVVCLQEVENRRVLEDLVEHLRRNYRCEYGSILHRDGPDHRGVDVAMLTRLTVEDVQWLTPISDQREILVATLALRDARLTVCCNHWKSRWGGREESEPLRFRIARALRAEVDKILATDPDAAIVVAGDFNDDVTDPSLVEHALIVADRQAVRDDADGRMLYNLHGDLPPNEFGTFYYRNGRTWNSFDSIAVTRTMLGSGAQTANRWRLVPDSYAVFTSGHMVNAEGQPLAFRRVYDRKTKRRPYQHGYSDHFPVRVTLTLCRAAGPQALGDRR